MQRMHLEIFFNENIVSKRKTRVGNKRGKVMKKVEQKSLEVDHKFGFVPLTVEEKWLAVKFTVRDEKKSILVRHTCPWCGD